MSPPGIAWTKETETAANEIQDLQDAEAMSKEAVHFAINGKNYQVSDLPVNTRLNGFIRDYAHLKGTKFMCLEGGCGACIVSVTARDPGTGKTLTFAVNSCLVPIYNCQGWSIQTTEALGNRIDGYGQVQKRLASNNGSQCGYCSPGMVMNMYSILKDKKELTMKEIENSFGGNICRCTGYRPILDAFKSFAKDAPQELVDKCVDIESLGEVCPKTGKGCSSTCAATCDKVLNKALAERSLRLKLDDGKNWYRVSSIMEIFEILNTVDDNSYMLVGGNTAYGVYRPTRQLYHYIDINGVQQLHSKYINDNAITLGANVSLTKAMEFFYNVAESHKNNFAFAKELADHIDLIANVPVRNTGTLGGNLSIKNQHREFPSDIFLILETSGAQVVIADAYGMENTVPLMQYVSTDMNKKVISQIIIPSRNCSEYTFKSYKIMPRAQNAHAYVNAGFLFKLNKKNSECEVLEKPTIVFGGIHPEFFHAEQTEEFLNGKKLSDSKVIQSALNILNGELHPDHVLPDASPEYRRGLAVSLLYKFILSLEPSNLSPSKKSGGVYLERPLSSAKQDFETDQQLWPLNKSVPKVEGFAQCAGEAQYVNDIPNLPGQLYGAVVTAKKATATSFSLDPKDALKLPGVVAFYSAKDIPGVNDFMSSRISPGFTGEEVFASKNILFAGQALGVIVAESPAVALEAAEIVKVVYNGLSKPIVNFLDVVKSQDKTRIVEKAKIEPKGKKDDVKHKVSGTFVVNGQYHYSMETQTCLSVPIEDGMDVYASTQWASMVQWTVASLLKMKENSVNVNVRRLGGAYGSKISRNNQVAAISALAAHLLKQPVRVALSLETNMQMVGKRFPCYIDYEVGVNADGKFQYLVGKIYQDVGATLNESDAVGGTFEFIKNAYNYDTWSLVGFAVRTDTPSNTWCRAPGSTEAVASIEHIMEHIANVIKKDPISVRIANLKPESAPLIKMIDDIKLSSDYEKRVSDVEAFNSANRWKKRGISLVPMSYAFAYWGKYHANMSIFAEDGTVVISHGGIECGQGLNTKVAQVCAYLLEIPLEYVKIKPTMTIIAPNDTTTGGSVTSEAVCYAVQEACKEMKSRLEPVRVSMPGAKWEEIVYAANLKDINLNINYMYKNNENLANYSIFGVCVLEVEVDILTGQHLVSRVDLIEDAGQSLSPGVDIGQVEGAFVMGLGYFSTEELVYHPETGKLLTDRTWNYKPPGAKDIPIDFRVTLLKNSRNLKGVLRSKATGEPPLNLSVSVVFAIRNALESARKDCGRTEDWFDIKNPLTVEHTWLSGLVQIKDMTL